MTSAAAVALAAGTFLVAAQAQQPGGANPGAQTPGAAQQAPESGSPKQRPQPKMAPQTQNGAPPKGSAQSKESPRSGERAAPRADDKSEPKTKRADDKAEPKTGSKTGSKRDAKSGQKAEITTEQRTVIRNTIVKSNNAPRVNNVNFNISVGTVVPRSTRVAVLPPRVVEVYPQWRGYRYVIVGDEIIIIDPNTFRIVFVLAA
jgi:hypothetical protein